MIIEQIEIDLPRDQSAPGLARQQLAARLRNRVGAEALANAAIVVSELVTNAVVHGRGRITLEACLHGDRLRIEVVDEGTGKAPDVREQPENAVGGWGLRIVDTLALDWGAFEGTTHVWAELPAA